MSRSLRYPISLSLFLVAAWSPQALADDFPIEAFVQEHATVHSGPSKKFYATQQLQPGTAIEIYKTTEDGWCGIRPLPTSFSLVPADAVTSTADADVFKLNREGVRTQVGSLISAKNDVKYITLHEGEPVKSLGRTPDGKWLMIAPPSGEFRWIHRRFLGSKQPSIELATRPTNDDRKPNDHHGSVAAASFNSPIPEDEPVGTSVQTSSPKQNAPATIDSNLAANAKPLGAQMQTVPIEVAATDNPEANAAEATIDVVEDAEQQSDATWKVRDESSNPQLANSPSSGHRDAVIGETSNVLSPTVQQELNQINVALSQIVLQETSKWDLTPVRVRAERVIDSAQNQADRQSGRELLSRIAEFESLQHRYDRMAGRAPSTQTGQFARSPKRSPSLGMARNNVPQSNSVSKTELAAFLQSNNRTNSQSVRQASHMESTIRTGTAGQTKTGWLMPVITSNPNMPKFAITDSDGKILCFVSEAAGVKLKYHLRKQVTLQGESAFSTELQKTHLIATRVVTSR